MTAAHDWRVDTGPIDFHDPDALAADPYLRDVAGRFAAAPLRVTAPARPALLPGYTDPDHPHRTVLVVDRCPHGSFARWAAKNCCAPRPTRTRRTR